MGVIQFLFENFWIYKYFRIVDQYKRMEANTDNLNQQVNELTIIVKSKKVQINSINDENASELLVHKDRYEDVTTIKIEGNSYSLEFCQAFGEILKKTKNIKNLNISDIFVSRLKDQIPNSVEFISNGLVGSNLLRLDISSNAVNPFGAEKLLLYLSQATSLQVLIIFNCGLGPTGVAKIAEGFKGTPSLKTLSIARNRMKDQGVLHIANNLQYVPLLEELFIYENSLHQAGISELFANLWINCKQLKSLDIADNHIKQVSTSNLANIIKDNLNLRNINISDNDLSQKMSLQIVQAFQQSKNRSWQKIGMNYCELNTKNAKKLLQVLKECPIKRLDIVGNDFSEEVQEAYSQAFAEGVLSKFEDEDEQQVIRLFDQMKI